jgi:lipoprotein-anchoring transpeptidase ErfK/SrfK
MHKLACFAVALLAALVLGSPSAEAAKFFDPSSGSWIEYGVTGGTRSAAPRVNRVTLPRVRAPAMPQVNRGSSIPRQVVAYSGSQKPGTIVVNTSERRLYLVQEGGKAIKYGIGVGRQGFQWSGTHRISRKSEWPGWTPPAAMRKRQPYLPAYMPGGPNNPLGARALYIGSTLYRIHGSNEPWTIGHAVSSGCIRMTNEDVMHLYSQVKVGTRVVVVR